MESSRGKLLRRLLAAQSTADSINSLSEYVRHLDPHSGCAVWFQAVQEGPAAAMLPLLYIANDAVQRSRAKTPAYTHEFAQYLERAFEIAASKSPRDVASMARVANILADRSVYSRHFMDSVRAAADRGAANPGAHGAGRSAASPPHAEAPAPAYATVDDSAPAYGDTESFVDATASAGAPTSTTPTSSSSISSSGPAEFDSAIADELMGGSLGQATEEAQRRNRVTLAVQQLLSTSVRPALLLPSTAAVTSAGAPTAAVAAPADAASAQLAAGLQEYDATLRSLTADEQARALAELRAAEDWARYALTVARMNGRRRLLTMAKLSESLASETTTGGRIASELSRFEAALARAQHLAEAADSGKAVRVRRAGADAGGGGMAGEIAVGRGASAPLTAGFADAGAGGGAGGVDALMAVDDFGATGTGISAGTDAAGNAFAPATTDSLMADDDWYGLGTATGTGSASAGAALMSAAGSGWEEEGGASGAGAVGSTAAAPGRGAAAGVGVGAVQAATTAAALYGYGGVAAARTAGAGADAGAASQSRAASLLSGLLASASGLKRPRPASDGEAAAASGDGSFDPLAAAPDPLTGSVGGPSSKRARLDGAAASGGTRASGGGVADPLTVDDMLAGEAGEEEEGGSGAAPSSIGGSGGAGVVIAGDGSGGGASGGGLLGDLLGGLVWNPVLKTYVPAGGDGAARSDDAWREH